MKITREKIFTMEIELMKKREPSRIFSTMKEYEIFLLEINNLIHMINVEACRN